jgi:hypothetical protein
MRKYWFLYCLKVTLFFAAAGAAMGYILMNLWNWLFPPIFGLSEISFFQAIGLLVISKILFSGFKKWGGGNCCHGRGQWGRGHWKDRFKEKISSMSPEEQAKVKESFKKCCGWESEEK